MPMNGADTVADDSFCRSNGIPWKTTRATRPPGAATAPPGPLPDGFGVADARDHDDHPLSKELM